MVVTRTLLAATIPLEGKIQDITQPMALVAQQLDAIYILCVITYSDRDGDDVNELIFTPYSGGDYDPPDGTGITDNSKNLLQGLKISSDHNSYQNSAIDSIYYPDVIYQTDFGGNFYGTVSKCYVAMIRYNADNTFTVVDQNGDDLGPIQTINGSATTTGSTFRYQYSIIGSSATPYPVTTNNSFFNFPNIYAGVNYGITFTSISPFRFMDITFEEIDGFLLTPSYCDSFGGANPPSKTFQYQCNQYYQVSPFNLLRYIDYISPDGKPDIFVGVINNDYENIFFGDPSPQVQTTLYNFFPVNFFPSNISFASGSINLGTSVCIPISDVVPPVMSDPTFFMKYAFYFWASAFSTYSNFNGSPENTIITQSSEGFIAKATPPPNSTGWTNINDCNRTYFYKYCEPNDTTPTYCGTCFGQCASGQTCSANPSFTPTQTTGNPFACGIPTPPTPTPPTPSDVQTFWEKYKKEIIILIIVFVVLAIIFLIFVFINPKNKNSGSTTQREIYVG